jgi:hypothetical protein
MLPTVAKPLQIGQAVLLDDRPCRQRGAETMPKHRTTTRVPSLDISDTDLVVKVRANNKPYGELTIRKGSVSWHKYRAHYEFRKRWEGFNDIMHDRGSKRKRR